MSVRGFLILLAFLVPPAVQAQGFAGLGQETDGFTLPDPDTRFEFPADHGPHPDFRVEWWYVTANLTDEAGTPFGMQWTLFRTGLAPGGRPEDQAWMGHAAVSTPGGHRFAERLARGGIGQAGVSARPFEAFIDEWRMAGDDLADVTLMAQGTDFSYDLNLRAHGPFVAQGQRGYSVKSEAGQASHYYSQPFYEVSGVLMLDGAPIKVSGQAWLDREWSSQPLTENQTGWDWVSLHLDGGAKLMGYRLRNRDGSAYTVGTWIGSDGMPFPLEEGALEMEARRTARIEGRDIPVTWRVRLPERGLDIKVDAIYPQSWMGTMVSYWEGPVRVTGSHQGLGYLEMSGY